MSPESHKDCCVIVVDKYIHRECCLCVGTVHSVVQTDIQKKSTEWAQILFDG